MKGVTGGISSPLGASKGTLGGGGGRSERGGGWVVERSIVEVAAGSAVVGAGRPSSSISSRSSQSKQGSYSSWSVDGETSGFEEEGLV